MSKKTRFAITVGIAILIALLPASASANIGGAAPNVGGAGPRTLTDDDLVKNVGGAGPRDSGDALAENVGGASPTQKNVGGASPRRTDSLQENVGGASPRSWSNWLLDLLTLG